MREKQKGSAMHGLLIWLVIVAVMAIGWVMNLVTLFHTSFDHMTGEIILRIIGVPVFFIGAVLGYL